MPKMRRMLAVLAGCAVLAGIAGAPTARATMDMQKKAKAAGFPVTNCMYCHNEKLPKKGAVTSNDRGKFLEEQKAKKAAKEIDVAWLKDYVEKK
jgi:hypothetical protein